MTGSFVSPALRQRVRDLATPIATGLGRLGLTPNALTVLGFLGTCAAAFAAANQWWLVAGVFLLVFGIFDLFDGTLARSTGRASKLGAFLDSTFDRAGEAIVFVGIAIGMAWTGFDGVELFAPAAMAASFMVSYTRAKSESLGFTSGTGMAAIGFMPREVRLVLLTIGLVFAGLLGTEAGPGFPGAGGVPFPPGLLVLEGTLGFIAVGATITTIQRILHVRAQAGEG